MICKNCTYVGPSICIQLGISLNVISQFALELSLHKHVQFSKLFSNYCHGIIKRPTFKLVKYCCYGGSAQIEKIMECSCC